MNTMKKIAYSILASVFVFANANAGDLSVTGSAKATYTIISVDGSATDNDIGKGIGIANEITLGASGELDNGWTWSYNQEIDGATVQDDISMDIGMGGLGTFKINVSDGGLQKNFSSSQSVYGTPVDNGEGGSYTDAGDTGGMHSIRYTTPSGLPYDMVAAIQFAPYTGASDANSSNAQGVLDTAFENALEYAISATLMEGLSVGASYFDPDDGSLAQQQEGGAFYATYDIGSVSLGAGKSYQATSLDPGTNASAEDYENTQLSIAFNVNDALSISYEDIESEENNQTAGSDVTMDVKSIQATYTVAGMNLSVSTEEYDNHDYTDGNKVY